jgi:hypothetical protein
MPLPYRNPHYNVFAAIPHTPQGSVGYVPATWVMNHKLPGVPNVAGLPHHKLDRAQVRAICRNPAHHVLFGYVCAMAWGWQGKSRWGQAHVKMAWGAADKLSPILNMIRLDGLNHRAAYNLFFNGVNNVIPGLGHSFFTKLLYFFSPQPNFYIMDQWTGNSVNLLTGEWVLPPLGRLPKCGNYQAFCREIDDMAALLGTTGEQIEERLFSKGGHHPWPWRVHVKASWPVHAPPHQYSATRLHGVYPHIPITDF